MRPKKGFTKRDIAQLYDEYIECRKKANPKMLAYFDLREVERYHFDYAYRTAYGCGPDTDKDDIKTRAWRTEERTTFRQLKDAYLRWKSADTESRRRRIEDALECQATVELGDAVKQNDKGKVMPRQFFEMSERGRRGLDFKVTSRGLEFGSGNRVAAASQLSRMNGWEAPQEHNINTLSLADLRFGFDDEDDGDEDEGEE